MAIGYGLKDVDSPGVSSVPDVSRGAGLAASAQADAYARVAQGMLDLKRVLTPIQKQMAEQQAYQDVKAGRFRGPRQAWDEIDEVYNQSAKATYLAQSHIDARQTIGELATANQYDSEAFVKAAQSARTNYLRSAPVAFHPDLDALWAQETTYQVDNINASSRRRLDEQQSRTQLDNVDQLANRVGAYAARGDQTSDSYRQAVEQWGNAFLAWGENPLSGLSSESLQRAYDQQLDTWAGMAASSQITEVYAAQGRDAAIEFIQNFATDPELDWTPEERGTFIAQGETTVRQMETERRLAETELRQQIDRIEDNFGLIYDPIEKSITDGGVPSPLEMARVREEAIMADRARALDNLPPVHVARVDGLFELYDYRAEIRALPPRGLEQEILALRAEGERPEVIAQAEAALKATEDAWNNNPIGTARALGVVPSTPLDFADPAGVTAQIASRAASVEMIEDYTLEPTGLLEPAERQALLLAAQEDPNNYIAMAQALFEGAPYERAVLEIGAITGEGADGVPLGYAGFLTGQGGDPRIALEIAQGLNLPRNNPEFRSAINDSTGANSVSAADVFRLETGDAYRQSPAQGEALFRAARARYELWAQARQLDAGAFDRDEFRRIVRETAGASVGGYGGFARRGERRITLPFRVRASDFNSVLEGLRREDLAAAGGQTVFFGGEFVPVLPREQNGDFVTDPTKVARARLVNADRPGSYYVYDQRGAPWVIWDAERGEEIPYVLDLNVILDALKARRVPGIR